MNSSDAHIYNWPVAYEHILDVWGLRAPLATTRARTSLKFLLKGLADQKDGRAYQRSTLTMTGSPFEPAFSFASPGLRYTIAPAPADLDLTKCLDYVMELLTGLDSSLPSSELVHQVREMQKMGELRYGAQIGGRHSAMKDSYKIYMELPSEARHQADSLVEQILGSASVLNVPGRNAFPTIIGIDIDSTEIEIYYRIENLHPAEIRTLLLRAHAEERSEELMEIISRCNRMTSRYYLPGSTWGYSYSSGSEGNITFSLYTFAHTLFGPDRKVRDSILRLGKEYNWDTIDYERMSLPLEQYENGVSHHGIFGIVVPPRSGPAAWVGLAPVKSPP